MKYFGSGNTKYKKWGRGTVLTFGIPAYQDAAGNRICHGALGCIHGCYAQQGRYAMPVTKNAEERRLALTRSPEFVDVISQELAQRHPRFVRLHDAGDFYNITYLKNWLTIMRAFPVIKFFAYTKAVPLFTNLALPENFRVVFSEGGRWDAAIDRDTVRHARVFTCRRDLKRAGYVDATHEDVRPIWLRDERKIGLVYHGWKSRVFAS